MAVVKKFTILLLLSTVLMCCVADSSESVESSEELDDCPRICASLYAPLCATADKINFQQFDNECVLRAANCLRRKENRAYMPFKKIDSFWCSSTFVPNLMDIFDEVDIHHPNCLKPCPQIYSPVCVSNGIHRAVISNECLMDTLNCAVRSASNMGNADNDEIVNSSEERDIQLFKVIQEGSC